MVGMMAKPEQRRVGRPRRAARRETVIAIKGSAEWKSWLDGFSSHCRLGLSDTIEQSLVFYAEERLFGPAQAVRAEPEPPNSPATPGRTVGPAHEISFI